MSKSKILSYTILAVTLSTLVYTIYTEQQQGSLPSPPADTVGQSYAAAGRG